ncbi:hypothetical protein OQH60_02080 [Campylobacter sp. MIT 21-1685]|uniref:hypothetical protein n=1 Tax=unclassified Campylobacter TaxID=2593542 RepID=UPI00224AC4F1|nr:MULTISPECIES: hypothetical protein [unclassified Campylobacter]MCX2682642.1 hypothetical protein [Campylobacter sp. MIT 21-1684]MCX2750922.1 hypothetical protein [Campylobacter sp. MIT 21-1682]MCX2807145.1 hypothetical protein [Campylobacter sp. MIT 21-1685]
MRVFDFSNFYEIQNSYTIKHHNFLGVKGQNPDYEYYLETGFYNAKSKKEFVVKHLFYLCVSCSTYKYLANYRRYF